MGDSFEDYLTSKKISAQDFKKAMPDEYERWAELHQAVHPSSFTAQKLYKINGLRRLYPMPKSSGT